MKYLILTWLLYPLAEGVVQWWLIEKRNTRPIYLQLFIIRGMVAILFGGLVMDAQPDFTTVVLLSFMVTSFWIVFDPWLNFLRGQRLLYRGKTSGWLDRMPYALWVIGKLLALCVMVWSFLFYTQ